MLHKLSCQLLARAMLCLAAAREAVRDVAHDAAHDDARALQPLLPNLHVLLEKLSCPYLRAAWLLKIVGSCGSALRALLLR